MCPAPVQVSSCVLCTRNHVWHAVSVNVHFVLTSANVCAYACSWYNIMHMTLFIHQWPEWTRISSWVLIPQVFHKPEISVVHLHCVNNIRTDVHTPLCGSKLSSRAQLDILTCQKCPFQVLQTNDQVNRSSCLSETYNQSNELHCRHTQGQGDIRRDYQNSIDATYLSITFLRALNKSAYTTWSGGTPSFQVPHPIPNTQSNNADQLHTNTGSTERTTAQDIRNGLLRAHTYVGEKGYISHTTVHFITQTWNTLHKHSYGKKHPRLDASIYYEFMSTLLHCKLHWYGFVLRTALTFQTWWHQMLNLWHLIRVKQPQFLPFSLVKSLGWFSRGHGGCHIWNNARLWSPHLQPN